jgi:hypothetical protein
MCAHRETTGKLNQFKVSVEQWEDAQKLCSGLEKASMITTQMGGDKYVIYRNPARAFADAYIQREHTTRNLQGH